MSSIRSIRIQDASIPRWEYRSTIRTLARAARANSHRTAPAPQVMVPCRHTPSRSWTRRCGRRSSSSASAAFVGRARLKLMRLPPSHCSLRFRRIWQPPALIGNYRRRWGFLVVEDAVTPAQLAQVHCDARHSDSVHHIDQLIKMRTLAALRRPRPSLRADQGRQAQRRRSAEPRR